MCVCVQGQPHNRPDNEPTMVLEVLAEQARDVAEQHRRSITQVLQVGAHVCTHAAGRHLLWEYSLEREHS